MYKGCGGCEWGVRGERLKQGSAQLNEQERVVDIREAVGTGEEARGQTTKSFSGNSQRNDQWDYRLDLTTSC